MAKLDNVNEIKCFICSTHLNNKNQEAKILYAKQVRKGTGRDFSQYLIACWYSEYNIDYHIGGYIGSYNNSSYVVATWNPSEGELRVSIWIKSLDDMSKNRPKKKYSQIV